MAKTTKTTKTKQPKPPAAKKHYVTCAHCEANFRLPIAETAVPIHRYQTGICPGGAQLPAPPEPRFVWILMGESPTTEDGNGTDWIEAVYATEADAIRSMYDSIDEAKRDGHTIHYDPRLGDDDDAQGDQDPEGDWTRDFHVNKHQVL